MRNANGTGSIVKLSGNRRRPYGIRKIIGWKSDGRPIMRYLGYYRTRREAEKALYELNNDPYKITDITLSDIWETWYALQDGKSDGTRKNYCVAYNHLEPLHDVRLWQLDRITLQKFYDDLDGTKNVAGNVKTTLQLIIDYAVKRGYMPLSALHMHDVIDLYSRPLIRTVERKVIPDEEVKKLWELRNEDAKIILVYLFTGLRFGELYKLKPEHCFDDRIEIVKAKTKAGIRTVPLCDTVKKILPIAPVPEYQTYADHFHVLLPDYNPHDTRHTFISKLTEAGVDSRIIKQLVGHSTKDITMNYTHISFDVLLKAVNQVRYIGLN